MPQALTIVNTLLEGDPDEIDAKSYFQQANTWDRIELITSAEWRAYLRNLGWKVASFYKYKSSPERRYAFISLTLRPLDNHVVDWQDVALIRDYIFELLEQKLKKDRDEMHYGVDVHAYGRGEGAYEPRREYGDEKEWNELAVRIYQLKDNDRMYTDTHLPYR